MFRESMRISWQNILYNKMRSFLTILGIIIGVASIIALITIIKGVTQSVTNTVTDMGANKITIQVKGTPLKQGLSTQDLKALENIDNIKGVSPTVNGKSNIIADKIVMEDVTIQGKNDVYFKDTTDVLESGRAINVLDVEAKNRVCLIGQDIVSTLFPTENPINQTIIMNGISYTIIGTLQKSTGFSASSMNDAVIIPYTTAMRTLGMKDITMVEMDMINGELSQTTTADIQQVLNTAFNYRDDGFSVSNMQSILDRVKEMTGMMNMMLVGIASISLFVGGIGIMNMMLVSVTERTSEIGLRKALGAEPRRIQQQFLLEAMFLSVFGGILGLVLGVIIAFIGCSIIGTSLILTPSTIALAIGFSCLVGVVFGYAPARKASQLNPIEALRSI